MMTATLAEPCIDCMTTGGDAHGRRRPIRTHGRCRKCDAKWRRRDDSDQAEPKPDGTPSYQEPARPCADCGTIWGGVSARMKRAVRIRSRCKRCYDRTQKARRRSEVIPMPYTQREPEPKPFNMPAWITPAKPCLDCRTVWGWYSPNGRSPTRIGGVCKRCYERSRSAGRRSVVKRISVAERRPMPEKPKVLAIANFAYAGVDHYRREWRKRFGQRRSLWWRVG
jgi:hypothetical protein